VNWQASPETDEDLIAARDFIAADNAQSARDFLDAAFETFDRPAQLRWDKSRNTESLKAETTRRLITDY
jgi:plasmid stabilization system protein ParE